MAEDADAERRKRLKQLFGDDFNDPVAKELSRVTTVEQPSLNKDVKPPPEWTEPRPAEAELSPMQWNAKRMTLWCEDRDIDMEKILLVPVDETRLSVVTAKDVKAGEVLFDILDDSLLTIDAAFTDPDIGRALRDMAKAQRGGGGGDGFETFAIAALLAAERVRRAAVRGVLKRQDDGILGGGQVLPKWQVQDRGTAQTNTPFSPFIQTLEWPSEDECLVDSDGKAEAVRQGSQLIAKLIEPCARNAWMRATQRKGLAQATSDEDCECTAMQALVLAMETTLEAPPPLGQPRGERMWGGSAGSGPALCPLANAVLPPPRVAAAAREAGTYSALVNVAIGRPTAGRVDSALRCVATKDLPASTVLFSDVPGAAAAGLEAAAPAAADGLAAAAIKFAPRDRVRLVSDGQLGTILTRRESDMKMVVKLDTPKVIDGVERPLVVLSSSKLEKVDRSGPKKRKVL